MVQFARSAINWFHHSQIYAMLHFWVGFTIFHLCLTNQIDVASNVKFVLQYNMPVAWVVQLIIHLSYLLIQNPLDMWCSLLGRPSWSHYSQIMLRTASWVGFIIFPAFIFAYYWSDIVAYCCALFNYPLVSAPLLSVSYYNYWLSFPFITTCFIITVMVVLCSIFFRVSSITFHSTVIRCVNLFFHYNRQYSLSPILQIKVTVLLYSIILC